MCCWEVGYDVLWGEYVGEEGGFIGGDCGVDFVRIVGCVEGDYGYEDDFEGGDGYVGVDLVGVDLVFDVVDLV